MSLLIERLNTENEMHAKNQSRQKVTNIGKPLVVRLGGDVEELQSLSAMIL